MCWMTRNGKSFFIEDGFEGSIDKCPRHKGTHLAHPEYLKVGISRAEYAKGIPMKGTNEYEPKNYWVRQKDSPHAKVEYIIKSTHAKVLPWDSGEYIVSDEVVDKSQTIYKDVTDLNRMRNAGHLNDLQAEKLILERIAKEANDDPDLFLQLANEVFVGRAQSRLGSLSNANRTFHSGIEFGDKGWHPNYQDGTPNQMRHLSLALNGGYHFPDQAPEGSALHEAGEDIINLATINSKLKYLYKDPKKNPGASVQDYDASALGIELGKMLKSKKLKVKDFPKVFYESVTKPHNFKFDAYQKWFRNQLPRK